MATLKQPITLKHQPNLGEEIEDVSFDAGTELTLLKEWAESALVKDGDGRLFNVPKDQLEL